MTQAKLNSLLMMGALILAQVSKPEWMQFIWLVVATLWIVITYKSLITKDKE